MDLAGFRAQFPALDRLVWLNTPTAPPGARPVLDALAEVHRQWEEGEFSWQAWEADGHATRGLFARLIGADESSVALMSFVAEAAATVAGSLPPGRVVVGAREFQSNLLPWLALRERGFEVVEVEPSDEGVVRTEALAREIDARTVLVAVSEVQSSNGFRVDLRELAARCRAQGARLFLDAAQSLGALRLDVEDVRPDFVACHGYKFLLGPRGAAWLYVRPDRIDELHPLAPNWKSLAEPYADYYGDAELAADARKLDTSLAWFSWPGARAALELLLELDPAEVEGRCLELAAAFREGAEQQGFRLVPQEAPTQVVGVALPDAAAVRARLKERRVMAAVRGGFLRLGFHAFNDPSDVEAALQALGEP